MPRLPNRFPALVLLVSLVASGCFLGNDAGARPMSLRVLDGQASILRDGEIKRTASGYDVRLGDLITILNGSLELRLATGVMFELFRGAVRIAGERGVELRRGRLLAQIKSPATIDADYASISAGESVFRAERHLALRVGVYTGEAVLSSAGEEILVPRLRQAVVAGGVVPRAVEPLRMSATDLWDRRFLGDALELDARLLSFGLGLEAQLGEGSGLEFFENVVRGAGDLGFLRPFLANRRSDVLIGLMLAIQVARSPSSVPASFRKIYELWKAGASWGLISAELGGRSGRLFELLLEAVELAGLSFAGGVEPSPGPQPSGASPPPPPPRRPPPAKKSPTTSPTPSPSPTRDPAEEIECAVTELLGGTCE